MSANGIALERDRLNSLAEAVQYEWLATNGIGGFAMGTVAGVLTRRYHGLLVAALEPPLGRTVLLGKVDEIAAVDDRYYRLYNNRWASGVEESEGLRFLDLFWLDGTTPAWRFSLGQATLEKRIWMEHGANITYVEYRLVEAAAPLKLKVKALVTYRDYHSLTQPIGWRMGVDAIDNGLRVLAYSGATPLFLGSAAGEWIGRHDWVEGFHLSVEAYRGQESSEALLHAGEWTVTLRPGEGATLVAGAGAMPDLDGVAAFHRRRGREEGLLARAGIESAGPEAKRLVLAADQFIVRRDAPGEEAGRSIIAGYPWFGDWGRDTMIALPGLALSTGRHREAAAILRTFARFTDQGMLPNRFPDEGQQPEYNTADATLWYFEAIRAYLEASGDLALVTALFPVLADIVDWHLWGTRYGIVRDPADGLLQAGEPSVQLTWMDAKVGNWVVTPRIGKPVEINALWYNALHIMVDFSRRLGRPVEPCETLAQDAGRGFDRFWSEAAGYCYDVLDGPEGHDAALRPNQLLAVSLPHSALDKAHMKAVVDRCQEALLTPHGLRSLAADHLDYQGHYGGEVVNRDGAYHQGTVWGWLIGPFVDAHYRVYGDAAAVRAFLRPLLDHLETAGLGSMSEIFDGDPPHTPRGCPAQAWTVAELLRTWLRPG